MAEVRKQLRRVPDRVLHWLRRRRVREVLRRRHRPTSLLVVCQGNICRSPFAAALLGPSCARRGWRVDSAGLVGPGRRSPPEAVRAAARYGVDLARHRSQLLTAETVRAVDLIVVMDPAQRREICARFGRAQRNVVVLGDVDPRPIDSRTIPDPVHQPLAVFEDTYARIERCVRECEQAIGAAARRQS